VTDFQSSFTDGPASKFEVKSLSNIPSHLKRVAALPREISMFEKLHAEERSKASCHARLSHSKQILALWCT